MGVGQDRRHGFHALEERGLSKREIQLGGVQDVEHDDLVPPVAKVLQAGDDPRHVIEHVGENGHDAALLEPLRKLVEYQAEVGLFPGWGHVEQMEQLLELRGLAGRLQVAAHRIVEDDQADRVLLLKDHIGQRRHDELRVLQLRDVVTRGVSHRLAGIEQQIRQEVGLFLVLLEIELVGL